MTGICINILKNRKGNVYNVRFACTKFSNFLDLKKGENQLLATSELNLAFYPFNRKIIMAIKWESGWLNW